MKSHVAVRIPIRLRTCPATKSTITASDCHENLVTTHFNALSGSYYLQDIHINDTLESVGKREVKNKIKYSLKG